MVQFWLSTQLKSSMVLLKAIDLNIMIAAIYTGPNLELYGALVNLGDNDPKVNDNHSKQSLWITHYLKSFCLVIHTQLLVRMYPGGFAQKIVETLPEIRLEQRKFTLEVGKLLSWGYNLWEDWWNIFSNPKCFTLPHPLLDIILNHLGLGAFDYNGSPVVLSCSTNLIVFVVNGPSFSLVIVFQKHDVW